MTYNHAQVTAKLNANAHRDRCEYEKSAFKQGNWFFYPCDDHVIRLRKDDGQWRAVLSTMKDRDHGLKALNAPTRAEAVLLMLMHMQTFAK
jgi:hypothetical protein